MLCLGHTRKRRNTFTLIYTPHSAARGCWNVRKQYTVAQPFQTSFCPQTKNENELCLKYIWALIECVSRLPQDILLFTLWLMHVSKQTMQIYTYLPIFHLAYILLNHFNPLWSACPMAPKLLPHLPQDLSLFTATAHQTLQLMPMIFKVISPWLWHVLRQLRLDLTGEVSSGAGRVGLAAFSIYSRASIIV